MRRVAVERDGDDYTLVVRIPIFIAFADGALRISSDQLASLSLTPAQDGVFRLLLAGRCDKEIAADLAKSVRVVKYHKTRLFRKLGCSSKYELMAKFGARAPDRMLE